MVQIHLNDERYIVAMNDRLVMKLFKEQDALGVGMSPLIIKKYEDYFVVSYKNLNLASDEFGGNEFIEDVSEIAKFVLELESDS